MKNVLVAVLAVAMGGCATMKAEAANDKCADDLVKRGYYSGNSFVAHKAASRDCAQSTPQDIAMAAELWEAKYHDDNSNFSIVLGEVHNKTPEAVTCAKQKWDAMPVEERRRFKIDPECTMVAMAPAPAATSAPVIANNAFDVLTASGNATNFLRLVEAAGFTDTLKSKEGITVFAMSDAAFAKEKPEYADWIATNNPDNLKRFISGLVAIGLFPSTSGPKTKVTTISGHFIEIALKKKVLTVEAKPVAGNKELTAGNGLVYIVDGDLSRWLF